MPSNELNNNNHQIFLYKVVEILNYNIQRKITIQDPFISLSGEKAFLQLRNFAQ